MRSCDVFGKEGKEYKKFDKTEAYETYKLYEIIKKLDNKILEKIFCLKILELQFM